MGECLPASAGQLSSRPLARARPPQVITLMGTPQTTLARRDFPLRFTPLASLCLTSAVGPHSPKHRATLRSPSLVLQSPRAHTFSSIDQIAASPATPLLDHFSPAQSGGPSAFAVAHLHGTPLLPARHGGGLAMVVLSECTPCRCLHAPRLLPLPASGLTSRCNRRGFRRHWRPLLRAGRKPLQ